MDDGQRDRLKRFLLEVEESGQEASAAALARLRAEDPALAAEAEMLLVQRTRGELAGEGIAAAVAGALAGLAGGPAAVDARQIGPYRLVEAIGSGGMGSVYRAVQETPIRREVAIKLLRGGFDLPKLLARFEAERRALALVEHPGIARILDAGADESGTPYIAMELVRGVPITVFCSGHPRRETLGLFVSVCRAVQHAHQRGIVHRDLKPSNILVSEVDGKPLAKVIDFGIARVVEEGAGPRVSLTGEGQIVGTLEYMSPEQAAGCSRDVDTRTDVYSLGAVLYELLTGALPHDLSGKSLPEAVEIIRNDPPRPFRRTTTEHRPDGDLETITLKALEIEAERRYDGPGTLADDIERYLRAEPIVARPPSTAYQLRKLVQRNRAAVILTGTGIALLAAFGITMSALYAGQRRERERAERAAAKAEAINQFLQGMLASADPEQGKDLTILQAVDRLLPRIDRDLRSQPSVLASVQRVLGNTYGGLGQYARAESLLQAALLSTRNLGDASRGEIAMVHREIAEAQASGGHLERAEGFARRALALVRGTGAAADEALCLTTLAAVLSQRNDNDEADSLLAAAAGIYRSHRLERTSGMAEVLDWQQRIAYAEGRPTVAESLARQELAIQVQVYGEVHPRIGSTVGDLAVYNAALGREPEADSLYRLCMRIGDQCSPSVHPMAGVTRHNFAGWLYVHGRHAEAESTILEGLHIWESSLSDSHPWVGSGFRTLSAVHRNQGKLAASEVEARKAVAIMTAGWGADHPSVARGWVNLGETLGQLGRVSEAEAAFRRAVTIQMKARSPKPLAGGAHALGMLFLGENRPDSAAVWLSRALTAAGASGDPSSDLAPHRCALGLALLAQGNSADAERLLSSCDRFRDPVPLDRWSWPQLCGEARSRLGGSAASAVGTGAR
jgi:serine/threonine protein kinase